MRKPISLSATLLFALLSGTTDGLAAPQILAVAGTDPVTLHCEADECGAEFTAFCLEQRRESPTSGTAYYAHDPDAFVLHGIQPDGTAVRLGTASMLKIASQRGHTAVRITVPEAIRREFEMRSLQVAVQGSATIVPLAGAGDPRPHSDADIAIAAGPLRAAGAAVVEQPSRSLDAARITLGIVNALPRRARASDAQRIAARGLIQFSKGGPGLELARQDYEHCLRSTEGGMMSLRQCLSGHHDALMGKLNRAYWKALETGS